VAAITGRRGFTLIEITVVVLIVALVLTTATVRLDTYLPSSRGEAAAREFLATLDLARTSAISYGRSYTVEIALEDDRYRIRTPMDAEGRPARSPEERVALSWNKLHQGVHFDGLVDSSGRVFRQGTYELVFDAQGSADELYLWLVNDAGEGYTLTVRVLALTGSSKVISGRAEPRPVTENDF